LVTIDNRTPEMLRALRIDMYWDDESKPALSVPFGDFFSVVLGRLTPGYCHQNLQSPNGFRNKNKIKYLS
jgi:hypothetical protein